VLDTTCRSYDFAQGTITPGISCGEGMPGFTGPARIGAGGLLPRYGAPGFMMEFCAAGAPALPRPGPRRRPGFLPPY